VRECTHTHTHTHRQSWVYAPLVVKCCAFLQCECGWNYANWTAETLLKCFKCICMNILAAHTCRVTQGAEIEKKSRRVHCSCCNVCQPILVKLKFVSLATFSTRRDPWPRPRIGVKAFSASHWPSGSSSWLAFPSFGWWTSGIFVCFFFFRAYWKWKPQQGHRKTWHAQWEIVTKQ